ncbi:hypothetical protein J4526_07715 [Desulfurococcaceae archaeon MEX13E-LK6-19]|nr:hypothetical protein J4526_07715 [Desulfurococcaceae archaeon MEX13E-LK6-19]
MDSREKSIRSLLVQLLISLKNFYTFKDLEQLLGVSQYNLWKYTSLNMIPEEQTARRIYEKITSSRIVEKIIIEQLEIAGEDNEWLYLWNPGLLDLVGFMSLKYFDKTSIDTVVGFPEKSITLGLAIAKWMRKKLCIACSHQVYRSSKYIIETYITSNHEPRLLYLPRNCINKNSRVLAVTNMISDANEVKALLNLIGKIPAKTIGLLAIDSTIDPEALKPRTPITIKILKHEINKSLAQKQH